MGWRARHKRRRWWQGPHAWLQAATQTLPFRLSPPRAEGAPRRGEAPGRTVHDDPHRQEHAGEGAGPADARVGGAQEEGQRHLRSGSAKQPTQSVSPPTSESVEQPISPPLSESPARRELRQTDHSLLQTALPVRKSQPGACCLLQQQHSCCQGSSLPGGRPSLPQTTGRGRRRGTRERGRGC